MFRSKKLGQPLTVQRRRTGEPGARVQVSTECLVRSVTAASSTPPDLLVRPVGNLDGAAPVSGGSRYWSKVSAHVGRCLR
jgi:hypothetical protein